VPSWQVIYRVSHKSCPQLKCRYDAFQETMTSSRSPCPKINTAVSFQFWKEVLCFSESSHSTLSIFIIILVICVHTRLLFQQEDGKMAIFGSILMTMFLRHSYIIEHCAMENAFIESFLAPSWWSGIPSNVDGYIFHLIGTIFCQWLYKVRNYFDKKIQEIHNIDIVHGGKGCQSHPRHKCQQLAT